MSFLLFLIASAVFLAPKFNLNPHSFWAKLPDRDLVGNYLIFGILIIIGIILNPSSVSALGFAPIMYNQYQDEIKAKTQKTVNNWAQKGNHNEN